MLCKLCLFSKYVSRNFSVCVSAKLNMFLTPFSKQKLKASYGQLYSSQNKNNYVKQKNKWRAIYAVVGSGFVVFTPILLRKIHVEYDDSHTSFNWKVSCYYAIPLRPLSRAWGWLTERKVPECLRYSIYKTYAFFFGCNLKEVSDQNLKSYESLADFFSRSLKEGARPIDTRDCVVSPADGTILNYGQLLCNKVEQVKGVTYSLESFLGSNALHKNIEEGIQDNLMKLCVNEDTTLYQYSIYLAPGDYHKFHSPVDWTIHLRRHFQGKLLSVNPKIAGWIPNLFSLNERVAYIGRWKYGFFSLTAVGATNVGSIRVYCDPTLQTNKQRLFRETVNPIEHSFKSVNSDGVSIQKGELFGEFRLGSTIVLIFEAPKSFSFQVSAGQKTYVGQALNQIT